MQYKKAGQWHPVQTVRKKQVQDLTLNMYQLL